VEDEYYFVLECSLFVYLFVDQILTNNKTEYRLGKSNSSYT